MFLYKIRNANTGVDIFLEVLVFLLNIPLTPRAYQHNAWFGYRPNISRAELIMAQPHKYCTGPALWGSYLGPSELEAPVPSRRNTTTACRRNAQRAALHMLARM